MQSQTPAFETTIHPSASRVIESSASGTPQTPGSREWHEYIYQSARANPAMIPWADQRPHPGFVDWLNMNACASIRPGARTIVVGCGLGDNVAELRNRGYDAMGIDVSSTAITMAQQRFPEHEQAFMCADLLDLPSRLLRRFEFVVEIFTIQSVLPRMRTPITHGIASLRHPRGCVLAICRCRPETQPLEMATSPPWCLTRSEFAELMLSAGLRPLSPLQDLPAHWESDEQAQSQLLGVFGS